jgi:alkyl hydroperoxide reductase subunit AhpF
MVSRDLWMVITFHRELKKKPTYQVVVIGSGSAGKEACLAAAKAEAGCVKSSIERDIF